MTKQQAYGIELLIRTIPHVKIAKLHETKLNGQVIPQAEKMHHKVAKMIRLLTNCN